MSYQPTYRRGDYKADCDDCGRTYKASRLRLRWDGQRVCYECWEPRQPQDFVKAQVDVQAPQWTRPEPADYFTNSCTTNTSIAGYAIAGCMFAGNTVNPGVVPPSTFVNPS